MSHDVFISYSSLDKLAADAVCHGLEAKGIRCWIAPRDQIAGQPYGEQITGAIEAAQVMVLVFSDNVNKSHAVHNEINLAASADVTIVPFRIAKVEFNSELHFYLGRMHWLDAFPQPVDHYIDALGVTVQRNLTTAPAIEPDPSPAPPSPTPPPTPIPPVVVAPPPPPHPAPAPAKTDYRPMMIAGGLVGALAVVGLLMALVSRGPGPTNATNAASATNATNALNAVDNGLAAAADNQPANVADNNARDGDQADSTPIKQADPQAVNYYETVVVDGGPPAGIDGGTVINTAQLVQSMRERAAGSTNFLLVDARGCGASPTIPTAICLEPDSLDELIEKAPNRAAYLVIFCHDGRCLPSFQLASAAIAAGYENVFWYRGGINAWLSAGLPSVAHDEPE